MDVFVNVQARPCICKITCFESFVSAADDGFLEVTAAFGTGVCKRKGEILLHNKKDLQ